MIIVGTPDLLDSYVLHAQVVCGPFGTNAFSQAA